MVNYRLATEEDYENINNFHNRIYQKERSMTQFLWEFHNCPFGKSIYVVATDDDKIIGTNCVIPIVLANSKGELIMTGKSEDTLVDSDYRGQNIFNNMYDFLFKQCANENIKIIWGYTSAKKPFQKIGFQVPFEHQQSLIVNKIVESYKYISALNKKNRLIQKTQILALCILSKLRSYKGYFAFSNFRFKIDEDQNITDQVSNLIESVCSENPTLFYIQQSKEFQQWRIYDNPYFQKLHTFSAHDSNDKLVALIVVNSNPKGVAYIVQSSFDSSIDEKEKVIILRHAVKSMFNKGVTLIRNWHFDTNSINKAEIEVFKKAGFIVLKKGIGFVWKEMEPTQLNPNNFLLSRISAQGVM
jgi:GNAT superfamily N-acetyltransferase